jgi:hypothetical protein
LTSAGSSRSICCSTSRATSRQSTTSRLGFSDRFAAVLLGVVDAMLEVFGALRRAPVELVVDDREDGDAHRWIGDWINPVALRRHRLTLPAAGCSGRVRRRVLHAFRRVIAA